MRILLSCQQSDAPHPLPRYDFWRSYFVQGCMEAGMEPVEVPHVDWAEGLICRPGTVHLRWRADAWQRVIDFVRREHARRPFGMFLGYLYPAQIGPAAIAELQRIGIPCVNFFCDNVREFRRVPDEYRSFALNWVPEFEALPMYREARLPHVHAPMPCWVPASERGRPANETEPPTFIGAADALRRHLLGHVMQCTPDLVVRGAGWLPSDGDARAAAPRSLVHAVGNQGRFLRKEGWRGFGNKLADKLRPLRSPDLDASRVRPAVWGSDYFRVTREAVVALGINRVPTFRRPSRSPIAYSRLRDIEAPMLGACYLTEWTAGLEQLYDIGAEVECYRSADELCSRLAALKQDAARRRAMRERAQRRASSQHSVARTLDRIARHLGVSRQP